MIRWRLVAILVTVPLLGLFALSQIEVPAQAPGAVAQGLAPEGQPRDVPPGDPPRQSMLRALYDALLGSDEIEGPQRDDAIRTLREADEILTRTKENNRRALAEVNRQVRIGNEHSPNIILIVADDLGYGELGSYGQALMQTPEIDEFAAEGIRFTEFYAGGAVDPVSRYTLMTGLHSGHLPPPEQAPITLDDRVRALAEVLWKAGYSTDGVGKWNLGGIDTPAVPWRQGFETWYGYLVPEEAAFAFPEFLWRNEVKESIPGNRDDGKQHYADDLFTEEVLEFLELRPAPRARPFFLYVAYTVPGTFREVPDDSPYADRDWTQPQKDHAAAVTRLDGYIGRITDKLEEQGLDRNTLVIFTSDTGPLMENNSPGDFFDSAGPLRGGAGELYEGGIRVPMIIRGWGFYGGAISPQVWANWDVLPTLAELTGTFPFPRPLDGASIVRVLRGADPFARELMYWTLDERRQAHAIRTEQWKGHRPSLDALLELYDLDADQIETNNVAGENPEVSERIEAILNGDE
jgi:arylsulfatase A-like enzyme